MFRWCQMGVRHLSDTHLTPTDQVRIGYGCRCALIPNRHPTLAQPAIPTFSIARCRVLVHIAPIEFSAPEDAPLASEVSSRRDDRALFVDCLFAKEREHSAGSLTSGPFRFWTCGPGFLPDNRRQQRHIAPQAGSL